MINRGIVLARSGCVGSPASTYDEPTVMWRMRKGALRAHAVINLRGRSATVAWIVNGRRLYVREFDNWTSALRWSDRLREQNWAAGWRLLPGDDEAPAAGPRS